MEWEGGGVSPTKQKAEIYREFGWRKNRRMHHGVIMHQSPRFGPHEGRYVPLLAFQCRQKGGILWAMPTQRWAPWDDAPAAPCPAALPSA